MRFDNEKTFRRGFGAALFGLLLALAGCGGDDDSATSPTPVVQTGSVAGSVALAADGAPLAGVTVSAAGRSTTTAADGSFTLTEVPVGDARVVGFARTGHVGSARQLTVAAGATSRTDVRLTAIGATQTVDAAVASVVGVAGSTAQVSLPAAGIVNAAGAAVSGAVTVEVTPLDPAADPDNMPGNYTAQPAAGSSTTPQPIESFGALDVKLKDAAGNPLNLGAGKTATIRIPLSTRSADVPATLPLYWFNDATGLWVQEGTAALAGTAPNRYYEGTVSHFTTWNADRPAETIRVIGCVQDAAGARVANADVDSVGSDYSGSDSVRTNANGQFSVGIRKGGVANVYATVDARNTNVVRVGPSQVDIVLPACLLLSGGGVAPQIVLQPESQTAQLDGFAYFRVEAIGSPVLRYQWKRNGSDIAGATGSVLVASPVQAADNAASYSVVVRNAFGTATSDAATLTADSVATAPLIVGQPLPQTVVLGATATFTVAAQSQGGTLTYQWRRDGNPIAGATGTSYTTPATAAGDDGAVFSVVVGSSNGTSVTSNGARLTVNAPSPLVISAQPQNTAVGVGQSASFSVTAAGGSGTLAYQWRRNGSPIAGATSVGYTTPATTLADNGAVYSVVVTSGAASLASAGATLTVSQPTGGNGYYLVSQAGPAVDATITFANGVQTTSTRALLAVNTAAPGSGAVTVEPAGQASFVFAGAFEATIDGGSRASNTRSRFAVYFKGGRLFKVDQVVADGVLPVPQVVSSLASADVCGQSGFPSFASTGNGQDFADPRRSWVFLRAPGADGICNTADDVYRAARLDMAATDAALTIGEPQVQIAAANGGFAGLIVRSGSQLQRLDANLANPTPLFGIDPASYDSTGGWTFGSSLPGRWLFFDAGKLWGVDLAAPATRVELATLGADESATSAVFASDDSGAYVALVGASKSRVLRVTGALAASSVATVDQRVQQMALTPTRLVVLAQAAQPTTPGNTSSLLSVPKAGGATTTLNSSSGSGVSVSQLLASGENVYAGQYQIGATGASVSTLVVGADGTNPQTLTDTALLRGIAPSLASTALGLDQVYAVLLADNVTGLTASAGSPLRVVEGATRSTLLTYGQVPGDAGSYAVQITADPLQYGQSGLFALIGGSSGATDSWDLLYFKSDAAGLIRVTNFGTAAPSSSPVAGGAKRAQAAAARTTKAVKATTAVPVLLERRRQRAPAN